MVMNNRSTKLMDEWQPIEVLPEPGERLSQYWVLVEGSQYHSGHTWRRRCAGLARTSNDGFYDEDVHAIEDRDCMDRGTGRVTHFLQISLPPFPKDSRKDT